MARQTELSDRKAAILRALVRHYIRTGEAVGSEALVQTAGLRVSSATIRNELASLEELGYLTQPHTSAGRAPTDQAYRFYVDMLPARPRLRDWERRAIVGFFDEALADIDDILRALSALPRRQREATVLRYYLDMDVSEIAAVLRIHEGTAKTTLFRARRALAEALGERIDAQEANDVAGI